MPVLPLGASVLLPGGCGACGDASVPAARLGGFGGWSLRLRASGGEGGSHPSNILDNGYAFGTVNVNGDTPVILANEGPDMGGYVCACTLASADM